MQPVTADLLDEVVASGLTAIRKGSWVGDIAEKL